jgi:hypothetical protein
MFGRQSKFSVVASQSAGVEAAVTDTSVIHRVMILGAILFIIGVGAVVTYIRSILALPKENQSGARYARIYGVVFVVLAGAYWVYSLIALRG